MTIEAEIERLTPTCKSCGAPMRLLPARTQAKRVGSALRLKFYFQCCNRIQTVMNQQDVK